MEKGGLGVTEEKGDTAVSAEREGIKDHLVVIQMDFWEPKVRKDVQAVKVFKDLHW